MTAASAGADTAVPAALHEQTARFEDGIDLAKVRALLAEAREKVGLPLQPVTTLNLVTIQFSREAYESHRASFEAASALHPARLISLIAEPRVQPAGVIARISTVRPRGSPLPLEHIVLTAAGPAVRHLESALTGLLAPEVPLVVVWGGKPEGTLLRHAADSADRLILDSGERPLPALAAVADLLRRGAPVGDLAWARIFPWQSLSADLLDLPHLREHRARVSAVRVTTRGPPGPEAALLAGWFKARVPEARVELFALPAEEAKAGGAGAVEELRFEAPPAVFTLRRDKGILLAQVQGDDDGAVLHRVRLPPDAPGRLLSLELGLLAGRDELYASAVEQAVRLAGARPATPPGGAGRP